MEVHQTDFPSWKLIFHVLFILRYFRHSHSFETSLTMVVFRLPFFLFACAQLTSLISVCNGQSFDVDECNSIVDAEDTGPYTFNFCDSPIANCKFCSAPPPPNPLSLQYTPTEPVVYNLTDVEELNYRLLDVEYTTIFAKDPLPWEDAIDLPFCHVHDEEPPALNAKDMIPHSGLVDRSFTTKFIDSCQSPL